MPPAPCRPIAAGSSTSSYETWATGLGCPQDAATQEIARSVTEAANKTKEVSKHVADVNEAADHTGSSAKQVLDAAGELSRQGETLRDEVDKFLAAVRAG
jgi:methyl-accepting chemotaxis protein